MELGDRKNELWSSLEQARRDLGDGLDHLLEECLQRSSIALTAELHPVAKSGKIDAFERALESGSAAYAGVWASQVTMLVNQRTQKNADRLFRQVSRLESDILALGASLVKADMPLPTSLATAFDVPGIAFPKERIADTGLEILMRNLAALLPRALRSRVLMRRIAQTVEEALDARSGRLRYAARQEIDRIVRELGRLARTRLDAAEDSVRHGLGGPADLGDDDVRALLRSCAHDEATAIALASDLDGVPPDLEEVAH